MASITPTTAITTTTTPDITSAIPNVQHMRISKPKDDKKFTLKTPKGTKDYTTHGTLFILIPI